MATTITATAEVSPAGVPRVRLALEWTGATVLYVTRADQDGVVRHVRGADPVTPIAGVATVLDYEASHDFATTYYLTDGVATVVTSSPVTVPSSGEAWLIHPGKPESSVVARVLEWPTWTRPISRGVFQPIGRKDAVVVSTRRSSESGVLSVYTDGAAERSALLDVLSDGYPVLLKGSDVDNAGTRWVSIGDVTETPVETDVRAWTVWSLPLDVVETPAGGAPAAVSYADADGNFASYLVAQTTLADYAELSGGEWMV